MITITYATDKDSISWDSFVNSSKLSTVFQTWEWGETIRCYKNKPYYIISKENGKIKGVLPLVVIKSRIFGKKMISMPFCEFGGPVILAKNKNALNLLIKEAKKIAREEKVEYIEFRGLPKALVSEVKKMKFRETPGNLTFLLDLTQGIDTIWKNLEKGRVRTSVRKAEREGLTLHEVTKRGKMQVYYDLWLDTQKRHGTPTHSLQFFQTMFDQLYPSNMKVFLAKYKNDFVGGIILFTMQDRVFYWSSVVLAKYRKLESQTYLVWKAIEWAEKNKFKTFDFGRTRHGTPIYFYKKGFAAKEEPLHDAVFFLGKPKRLTTPGDPKFQIAVKIWSLLPVKVAKLIGPTIISGIGL